MSAPYALPAELEPDLRLVHAYWEGLIRGANDMPFWDDFKPDALPELAPRLCLLDVFDEPFRLHFGHIVGAEIHQRYGATVTGRFLDELTPQAPFEFLASQGSAVVEHGAPNFWRRAGGAAKADAAYARLLLPMWGNGRIEMLLCAFSWR